VQGFSKKERQFEQRCVESLYVELVGPRCHTVTGRQLGSQPSTTFVMSRRSALPLSPLRSSLPSERPPYVAVSPLRRSVVEPVESLLTSEACLPIRFSLQSACQDEPRQIDAFGGFCGSNGDARISPALRRSWTPQHAYVSSLRQAGSVPLSQIKPALPRISLSDWGRAPIQSTLSAAHAQYARRLSPLVKITTL
jgi:hypothetical protein